jgi:golgi phosphoprotein 3
MPSQHPFEGKSLLEEFLLLALDEKKSAFHLMPRHTFDAATVGAVLMELAFQNKIDLDPTRLFIVDPLPLGEDFHDAVLAQIALQQPPCNTEYWLTNLAAEAPAIRERALVRLEQEGVLRREDQKILWLFGRRDYLLTEPLAQQDSQARIRTLVMGQHIPTPRDVMLVGLAAATSLFSCLLTPEDLKKSAPRLADLKRMDWVSQAMQKAIAEAEAILATAASLR